MEIQNLINFIENNGLHYITCRLQMTWGQSDKVELAERFDTWALQYEQRGVEKGIEKGIEKGEALVLQKLLTKRFGTLPPEVVGQISVASVQQIDTWVDRVLDAESLDAVFAP